MADGPRWNPQTQTWEFGPADLQAPDSVSHAPAPEAGAEAGGAPAGPAAPQPAYDPLRGWQGSSAADAGSPAGPPPAAGAPVGAAPGAGPSAGTPPLPPLPPTAPVVPGSPYPGTPGTPYPTAPYQGVDCVLPAPPPLPPRPQAPARSGWLSPLTVGVAVAALVAGAAAVWFVQRGGDATPQARATAPATPTDGANGDGTRSPSDPATDPASASPSPSASGVPAGFREVRDASGFTTVVPEDWQRSQEATGVFYRSADRAWLLQVFTVEEAGLSPLEAVRGASQSLSGKPGYREERTREYGDGSADLVYAYDNAESGGRRKGIERVFVASDGKKYAVLVAGPETDWPRQAQTETAVVDAFRPTS
ncbi:serine/arginine repetitive matrix protein 2 [Streptomyces sp. NPDC093225]|uniref:serine/arginine repetitive matrix protein 2 n=1 Tax=Streptomyces sp. NPDC093225 TaxID=3366034 RepID=UPI0037F5AFC5